MLVGIGTELLLKRRMFISIWLLVSLEMSQLQHQFTSVPIPIPYTLVPVNSRPRHPRFKMLHTISVILPLARTLLQYFRGIPATLTRPFLST